MQDMKLADEIAEHENAGHDNARQTGPGVAINPDQCITT